MRDERTYKIIGAALEVHKELGCGFLEAVYQEALEREFVIQRIPFKSQPIVEITYKGRPLNKTYQPDFMKKQPWIPRAGARGGKGYLCLRVWYSMLHDYKANEPCGL